MSWISDVKMEITQLDTSPASLKSFNWMMLGIFGLMAGIGYYFTIRILLLIGLMGFLIILTGSIVQPAGRIFYKFWMGLAFAMGWIVSRLLLFIIFFLVVTPIGLLARITGKKFLDVHFKDNQKTYWRKRENPSVDYTKMS